LSIVVVRLVGGLGNQLFQYAAARAVALRSGADLVFDLSWFASVTDRKYALAPFAIDARILADSKTEPMSRVWSYWQRIERRLVSGLGLKKYGCPIFMERHFHFDLTVLNLRAPAYLDGYFQSERYFADCVEAVTRELTMPPPSSASTKMLLEEIQASDAICLHIRRGDYVANPVTNTFHGTCSLDYYAAGFAVAAAKMRDPKCFVFSDDPDWVRSNLILDAPTTIVDIHGPGEPHEDLRLMAACKNYVIANSSLSWWGAWLGKDPDKRVIAPKTWFSGSANDTSDLLPSAWLRL
jgi:Glycosyl transferase family 11